MVHPSRREHPRRGFTLIEMLVVIVIIGVLAGILLPALLNVRERAKSTYCQNNLRNLGAAMRKYCLLYDGYFPVQDPWRRNRVFPLEDMARVMGLLGQDESLLDGRPAHEVHRVIQCPSCAINASYGYDHVVRHYTVNAHLDSRVITGTGDYETRVHIGKFPSGYRWANPSWTSSWADFQPHKIDYVANLSTVMVFMDSTEELLGDSGIWWDQYEYYICSQMAGGPGSDGSMRSNRHSGGCNMVFLDGHVEWKPYDFFVENGSQSRWLLDTDTGNVNAWWPTLFGD